MEQLFYDIFYQMPRQGPGDKASTLRALHAIPGLPEWVNILDVGCGTGNQTLNLAGAINGKIIAIDNYKPFVDKVNDAAKTKGLEAKIEARVGDMMNLKIAEQSFDIIWSEGALYIMGLRNALRDLKRFLKPMGYFVVSDFNWFTNNPPRDVYEYFKREVSESCTPDETIKMIKHAGYTLLDHFLLPDDDWEYFYSVQEKILEKCRKEYLDQPKALEVIEGMQFEIDLYRKNRGVYGYGFYVTKKNV